MSDKRRESVARISSNKRHIQRLTVVLPCEQLTVNSCPSRCREYNERTADRSQANSSLTQLVSREITKLIQDQKQSWCRSVLVWRARQKERTDQEFIHCNVKSQVWTPDTSTSGRRLHRGHYHDEARGP